MTAIVNKGISGSTEPIKTNRDVNEINNIPGVTANNSGSCAAISYHNSNMNREGTVNKVNSSVSQPARLICSWNSTIFTS